jgi:glycosyltransferase involved in cell wall biosynthesis
MKTAEIQGKLFSVLLPTRNGGEFLDNCIRSILDNERDDIELVVSDNANTDATSQVLEAWAHDQRLKVIRQKTVLSVTDNWNAALNASVGQYVLMMGDDDYLLPGYFEAMSRLIDQYQQPDCILYNALSYVAPGSIGEDQQSYYGTKHFKYGVDLTKPQILDAEFRKKIVDDMFDFKVRIPLNMQTTLVKRASGVGIAGGLFQPPFPDHFALNAMLLTCERWLFSPEAFVVVGISPKSFGHYVYSQKQQSGLDYLGITANFEGRLPGNELLNGMHVWLNMLKKAYPKHTQGIEINRAGYVRRQLYAWLMQCRLGALTYGQLCLRVAKLPFADKLGLLGTLLNIESWRRLTKMFRLNKQDEVAQQWQGLIPLKDIKNIAEFVHWHNHQS